MVNRVADKCTAAPKHAPSGPSVESDFSSPTSVTASLFSLEMLVIYLEIKMVKSAFLCLSDIL